MRRENLLLIAGLLAVQAAAVVVYRRVEDTRRPPFVHEALDRPAPALVVERAGEPVVVEGPVVVHFWATWCAPCVVELPGLLAAAEREGVRLVAVSDEPWSTLVRWFGGTVPRAVARDPQGTAAGAWEVSGLPDTLRVHEGRIVGRVGGPRDWNSEEARAWLRGKQR